MKGEAQVLLDRMFENRIPWHYMEVLIAVRKIIQYINLKNFHSYVTHVFFEEVFLTC